MYGCGSNHIKYFLCLNVVVALQLMGCFKTSMLVQIRRVDRMNALDKDMTMIEHRTIFMVHKVKLVKVCFGHKLKSPGQQKIHVLKLQLIILITSLPAFCL